MRSPANVLTCVALACASIFPVQPLYRCHWTGKERVAVCCCPPAAAKATGCASCRRSERSAARTPVDPGPPGGPELLAFEGDCCSIGYAGSPRMGSGFEASRKLEDASGDAAPAVGVDLLAAPAARPSFAFRRPHGGPEPPSRPPLYILHRALLL